MIITIIGTTIGTLITLGLTFLIKGQKDIRNEARDGRKEIYGILNDHGNRLTSLEAHHKQNHPNQLS